MKYTTTKTEMRPLFYKAGLFKRKLVGIVKIKIDTTQTEQVLIEKRQE